MSENSKLFIVHGGDSYHKQEDYLQALAGFSVFPEDYLLLEKEEKPSWKKDLQNFYANSPLLVIYPSFPDKLNAKYAAWKIWFEKILAQTGTENLSLLGHSLGGNFLLKYLAENHLEVQNLYLVASCLSEGDFQTPQNLDLVAQNCQNIQIYHSTDDQIVPFEIALKIKEKLPKSHLQQFEEKGHFLQAEFPELKERLNGDFGLGKVG